MEHSTGPVQQGFVSPLGSFKSLHDTLPTTTLPRPRTMSKSCSRRASPSRNMSSPSASEDEEDHDYTTDFTTPASSDSGPEDNGCDEVEDFRDREYPQLKDKVYLDHGGTTIYAKSLIEEFSADMISNLYGNPHSASSPSALAGHRVDAIREKALRFFNADPEHFELIFTANATASVKLVIDCFRDHAQASNTPVWYGYHKDAHTSLVGVRELTKLHRCFTSDEEVDLWINSGGLGGPRARQLGLFAYPGQSNMTGRRLPLNWPGRIRKQLHKATTYTLLDAAALASTAPLDLSDPATAPDFVALSFYKIFGFPNIGALLVRKESQHVLEDRRFFGGGTVDMIISINDTWHAKKQSLHDALEDGTLPFHSIFALDHAIDVHERLYGPNPMKFISYHTAQLAKQLYDGLLNLKHGNGLTAAIIYKDDNAVYGDPTLQGATIAFNLRGPDGSVIGYEDVEEAADERNIYVRSGSLCNPGGVATYLNWSPSEMKAAYAAGHRCSNPTQLVHGKPTGVVRVSLGAMSTAGDVLTFLHFISEVFIDADTTKPLPQSSSVTSPIRHANPNALYPSSTAQIPTSTSVPNLGPLQPLVLPNNNIYPSGPPSATTVGTASDASAWDPSLPSSQSMPLTPRPNPPGPAFDREAYHPMRLRRNMTDASKRTSFNTVGMEIKVHEDEMHPHTRPSNRSLPPSLASSVKSSRRRFGRSVVSLLHRKGYEPPPEMPA